MKNNTIKVRMNKNANGFTKGDTLRVVLVETGPKKGLYRVLLMRPAYVPKYTKVKAGTYVHPRFARTVR